MKYNFGSINQVSGTLVNPILFLVVMRHPCVTFLVLFLECFDSVVSKNCIV